MQKSVFSFVAVRHGQTKWNAAGIFQGHLDSELTDTGMRQARKMGNKLKSMGIKTLVSSDLGRAMQTAEIIKSVLGVKYHLVLSYFRERNLGSIQGVSREDLLTQFPPLIDPSGKIINYENVPGLENSADFAGRILAGLNFLATLSLQNPIAVITHGGVIRFLTSLAYIDSEVYLLSKRINHSEIHKFILTLRKGNRYMNDKGEETCVKSSGKECVDTVEEYIPAYPNSNDYEIAKQSALRKARDTYGENVSIEQISELCSKLTFVVLK